MYKKENNNKNFLIFLFMFSLLIRAAFFLTFLNKNKNFLVCTDSAEYQGVGLNIFDGKGMRNYDGLLNFRRLPGYPIFLASCYKIFGVNIKKALWVQIFISSFIPILIFFLSLAFFPLNLLLAKIVSIWSTVHLGFLLHAGMIQSDTLFVIFFLLFSLLFFLSLHLFLCKERMGNFPLWKIFFSGVFLGVASLIRPVGHYCVIVSLLVLAFSNLTVLQKCKSMTIFFSAWVLVVFWWLLRNFLLTGFLFFHTLPGIHFLIYSASYVYMERHNCSYHEAKKRLIKEWDDAILKSEREKGRVLTGIERCYVAEQIAFDHIKKSPFIFLKHSFLHMFKTCVWPYALTLLFWDSGKDGSYYKKMSFLGRVKRLLFPRVSTWFVAFIIYLEMLLLFVGVVGFLGFLFLSFFYRELLCILLKILPFMFLFVFVTLAYGIARLRLPIEPFQVIFSFYFWIEIFKKYFKSESVDEKRVRFS